MFAAIKSIVPFLFSISLGVVLPSISEAQGAAVKLVAQVSHADTSNFRPVLGTYDYVISWEGIPAAEATVSVDQEGLRYRLVATARTYSGIDLFYKLRYRAEGLLSAVDLSPIKTIIDQTENSTVKNFQIEYLEDGSIKSIRSKNGQDANVTIFAADDPTLEPFSAAFLARSFSWEKGQTRELDTFNGKTRYIVALTAIDEIDMRVNSEQRRVWVIAPKIRLASTSEPQKKIREAKIYVTADDRRELLKIVSSVFVGSVTTALDAFTPSRSAATTHVAERERVFLK